MYKYKANVFPRPDEMVVDRRLLYCPYGSCGVDIARDGGIMLWSYITPILYLTPDGDIHIKYNPTCSATTRKHVGAFLKEYCPGVTYHDVKSAYHGGYTINAKTGDHVDNETGEVLAG